MNINDIKIKEIEKKFYDYLKGYHILSMSKKDNEVLISYVNEDWLMEKGVCAVYNLKNDKIRIINTTIDTFDGAEMIIEYKVDKK